MSFYRPKVYTASKLRHAALWQSLFDAPGWDHVEWTARWPRMAHLESGGLSSADLERLKDLEAANEAATSWGAAVAARDEEIRTIKRKAAVPLSDFDFQHFWTIDVTDVRRSDFVLLFGDETLEAPLRGAIFEAGVAVAHGKTVLAVQLDPRHTWSNHPLVCRLDTLEAARKLLLRYCTVPPARILPNE